MSISKCHPSQHTSNSNLMKIFFRFRSFFLSFFPSLSLCFACSLSHLTKRKREKRKKPIGYYSICYLCERETRARDRCLFYTVGSLSYVCLYVRTYIYTHGGARILPSKSSNNVTPSRKKTIEKERGREKKRI